MPKLKSLPLVALATCAVLAGAAPTALAGAGDVEILPAVRYTEVIADRCAGKTPTECATVKARSYYGTARVFGPDTGVVVTPELRAALAGEGSVYVHFEGLNFNPKDGSDRAQVDVFLTKFATSVSDLHLGSATYLTTIANQEHAAKHPHRAVNVTWEINDFVVPMTDDAGNPLPGQTLAEGNLRSYLRGTPLPSVDAKGAFGPKDKLALVLIARQGDAVFTKVRISTDPPRRATR